MDAGPDQIARFSAPHGTTANCINPGIIDTPLTGC